MKILNWRQLRALALPIALLVFGTAHCTWAQADAYVFHASSPGQRTLDQGEGGGNPFASALIELLARPHLTSADLPRELKALTQAKSRGAQDADLPDRVEPGDWSLVPAASREKRIALVLVVSDYSRSGGAKSLPGAKRDASRIAAALTAAGFNTEIALDYGRTAIKAKLADFARETLKADAAVIYTTGHGVEVGGSVFLIPADYPVAQRNEGLSRSAVPLIDIASALHAKRMNLVFYGGCRDDPFGR
jgi:hypothetical protein